jgi:hypothetical protein
MNSLDKKAVFGSKHGRKTGIDKTAFQSYPLREESTMANVVKKSLSIEKTLAAKVEEMAAMEQKPFSQIVSEAVSSLVDRWEMRKMEAAYQKYYSRQRPAEREMAASFLRVAKKTLPKHGIAAR